MTVLLYFFQLKSDFLSIKNDTEDYGCKPVGESVSTLVFWLFSSTVGIDEEVIKKYVEFQKV